MTKLERNKVTDPIVAQAAIAYLISQGWIIDLYALDKQTEDGLQPQDWLNIANMCFDFVMDGLFHGKVIPMSAFRKRKVK